MRAVAGFGASATVHTEKIRRLSVDLAPDRRGRRDERKIQEILRELDRLIGGGLVTLEPARVILYRPTDVPDSERWWHGIEGLEPEGG